MAVSLALPDAALLAECREEATRSGGPGGQHVNKTASAVRLVHLSTGVVVQCQDHRERQRNRTDALRALRLRLACTQRGGADIAWVTPWRRGRQLVIGVNAQAYPQVVACALDALERAAGDVAAAAGALELSSSQFAKLLAADKEVHQAANALRARHGHGPLLVR